MPIFRPIAIMKSFSLMTIFFGAAIMAQAQRVITGRVIDADTKQPLKEVLVSLPDTVIKTNFLGYFQVSVENENSMILEKDGYESGLVNIPKENSFLISLSKLEINQILTDYEMGAMRNGFKVGVWKYYDDPNSLVLEIDYDQKELIYIMPDTTSYVILDGNEWVEKRLDIQPRYIGSMHDFYRILHENVQYPKDAFRNPVLTGDIFLSFEVDTTGSMGAFKIHNDIGYGFSEAVINALVVVPNFWTVGSLDGQLYKSKFIIPFKFRAVMEGKAVGKRIKSRDTQPLPVGKMLEPVLVEVVGVTRESNTAGESLNQRVSDPRRGLR